MLEKPILVHFLRCTNFNNTFLVRTCATLVHSFYSVAQDSRAGQSDMHFQTSAFPCFAFKLWPAGVGASWEISFWKNANSPTLQTHVVLIGPSISRVGGRVVGQVSKLLWGSSFRHIGSLQLYACFSTCQLHLRRLKFSAQHIWNLKVHGNIKVAKACVETLTKRSENFLGKLPFPHSWGGKITFFWQDS